MMGPVASLHAADALSEQLAAAGYRAIDAGFIKRRFFRKEADGAGIAYHLHLVVAPAWPVKNELMLRDWLMEHPELAREYEALKVELAARYRDDMPQYTQGKSAFLQAAVQAARRRKGLPAEEDWNE
ncbi:MAG TPA: GrpB family protein, partial [Acidobacteriaceae bacterium]|nr:GrpB family protein [Acidobacteriaceae bacterium]